MPTFTFITLAEALLIKADLNLHFGAFNHPIIIVSCPPPKSMTLDSKVKVAIMTSFNGNSIKKHLASKGIKHKFGAVAAQRSGYLRVVTASKLCAKDTLKLRNGKGMKRDYSYVNVKETYEVSLRALTRYGFGKEEVGAYRSTAHALKVLLEEIMRRGRRVVKKC